jgi:hypothetical protein
LTEQLSTFEKYKLAKSQNPDFDMEAAVLQYEQELIRGALEECGGSVTQAARLLGVTHQGLVFIISGRQKALLAVRSPIVKRRKSIITISQPKRKYFKKDDTES